MAANIFQSLGVYHANGRDVPCIILVGYDGAAGAGNIVTAKSSVVSGDILVLSYSNTYLPGVTKGTAASNFEFSATT